MASSKSKSPFETSPEKELRARLKTAKKLTRKEFAKRVQEAREELRKNR